MQTDDPGNSPMEEQQTPSGTAPVHGDDAVTSSTPLDETAWYHRATKIADAGRGQARDTTPLYIVWVFGENRNEDLARRAVQTTDLGYALRQAARLKGAITYHRFEYDFREGK